jgi:hypothetical protein
MLIDAFPYGQLGDESGYSLVLTDFARNFATRRFLKGNEWR